MWEDPDALHLKKLSREEYCQRILTSLILGAPYPCWNAKNPPSSSGEEFLISLYERAFNHSLDLPVLFIDEFNLPAIADDEQGGAPDYAVMTSTRLWLIELKTEVTSHRREQLQMYARLAAHHYPDHLIDLLYLTPEMRRAVMDKSKASHFAHLFWAEIADVLSRVWASSSYEEERRLYSELKRQIMSLHVAPRKFRDTGDVIRAALTCALRVQETGEQCAVEIAAEGLEDLMTLRLRIRNALSRRQGVEKVKPWIWQSATSGGAALTRLGSEVGFELRLSLYSESRP